MTHAVEMTSIPPIAELAPYASKILRTAQAAQNEEQLKIEVEDILRTICSSCGIFWNPYTYEHSFRSGSFRLDAVHGSTIIEYEPPRSFNHMAGAQLRHARQQSEDYCNLLAEEEGRRNGVYSLVVWDGETISFGDVRDGDFFWNDPESFDAVCLHRLLALIDRGGKPLVSPMALKQFIGPDTEVGKDVIPSLYQAIVDAINNSRTTRTKLIFTEWARLFGQVDGTGSERLQAYLSSASAMHGVNYREYPQAYVFALNTYIAIVAKVCAVHALIDMDDKSAQPNTTSLEFLKNVENGMYFKLKGIQNMLTTDFFSWYLGADVFKPLAGGLQILLDSLSSMDFDVARKSSESVIDLFKGLYMEFTPTPMRHALGEYYTPDWLAAHVIDLAGWNLYDSLLDPTCGSGTFLLEAVKRRLEDAHPQNTASEILEGLYGFDLNPLAVLTARASLVVFLAGHFSGSRKILLPVFLADAINTADPEDGVFTHSILTEKGEKTFAIPYEMALSPDFYDVMDHLRICVDSDLDAGDIAVTLEQISPTVKYLDINMKNVLSKTITDLVELHRNHWNGIWCFILFDRIKAGCVHDVDYVVGNPPWVKWSDLPRPYAEFIKPLCERMDIFSEDNWVGGIQSDISTVVTYHALDRFVRPGGLLAFLITGTVFKNESSQGFRRWTLHHENGTSENMSVELVEDYKAIRPFEGVANWPSLLILKRNGENTTYPVTYREYRKPKGKPVNGELLSMPIQKQAIPIPGTIDGPWLVGSNSQLSAWSQIMDADPSDKSYSARQGVTTDANGIYFVSTHATNEPDVVRISNDPRNGRRSLPRITADVESSYIYPLLRGREISRFNATPSPGSCVIVPQAGMFGDDKLPATSPQLFKFLARFKNVLETRSSYRRFQKGKPFWSIWTVGTYTFAPYKVVWKEMSGSSFVAAYIGSETMPDGTMKTVVPDHKVYFIPVQTEPEAAYLTAFLNSSLVSGAIMAYASALSLGTSVVDYLTVPKFDANDKQMAELSEMGRRFSSGIEPTAADELRLDELVTLIVCE